MIEVICLLAGANSAGIVISYMMEEEIPIHNGCWSDLPSDLLIRIMSELEIPDLLVSGAVCRSWNAQHTTVRRLGLCSAANQGPFLLYAAQDGDPTTATLHRLSTGKLYRISLPEPPPFHTRYVFGSSHGWLAAADEKSNPYLFNPITGAQIDLPPVKTLAHVKFFFTKERVLYGHAIFDISPKSPEIHLAKRPSIFKMERTRHTLYMKVELSCDPTEGGNCTAMLMHKPRNQLSFARIGDSRWTWIVANKRGKQYDDCFYDNKDGVFYAVMCSGEVHAIDLNGPTPVVEVITEAVEFCEGCNKYIVRAPWGDLLEIWRYHCVPEDGHRKTDKIIVYRIDLNKDRPPEIWNDLFEINDLQGNALFVGFGTSFFVMVKDFPMLTPNCIYLSHDKAKFEYLDKIQLEELLVYNLADGTLSDFLPQHSKFLNSPPPIWIRPSFSANK